MFDASPTDIGRHTASVSKTVSIFRKKAMIVAIVVQYVYTAN